VQLIIIYIQLTNKKTLDSHKKKTLEHYMKWKITRSSGKTLGVTPLSTTTNRPVLQQFSLSVKSHVQVSTHTAGSLVAETKIAPNLTDWD